MPAVASNPTVRRFIGLTLPCASAALPVGRWDRGWRIPRRPAGVFLKEPASGCLLEWNDFQSRVMLKYLRLFTGAAAQGLSSIRGNPLRAGLGALAVAVAVATIVVVVTALDGLGRYARTTGARAFGSDT